MVKKQDLIELVKDMKEDIKQWKVEDIEPFERGYTSGFEAAVNEIKEKFKL